MALVTGTLRDFQVAGAWANTHAAQVEFVPSNAAFSGPDLRADDVIVATIDSGGAFSVSLASTASLQPAGTHYRVRIRWLGGERGGMVTKVPGKLYVPGAGGNIGLLLEQSPGAEFAFWQPTQPDPWPVGAIWVNSVTGDVTRKV